MWQELDQAPPYRPSGRDIKITDVKSMGVRGNPKGETDHYVWGIVKLETNTEFYGIGETFRGTKPLDVIPRLEQTVVGENPLDPARIAEKLQREHYTATGGIGRAAIAAIETACWDVKGKLLNLPVYELLGGKYRDSVPAYSDTEALAGDRDGIDFTEEYTPDAYADAARRVVNLGFQALKFDLDVPTPGNPTEDRAARRLDNPGIEHKVKLVAAVRDEIGYDIDLGMDLHWSYTVETAIRLGRKLEEFDLAFLEDPVHPEKHEAQSRVAKNVNIPILTGENFTSVEAFDTALHHGYLDIAAPDVAMCGGLAEQQHIAAVCDIHGVPIAPHNLGSPVSTVAGTHLGASVQNCYSLEFRGGDTPWWEDLVTRTGETGAILENGQIRVPEGPGLGIDLTDTVADYVMNEWVYVF